ncbi:UNVERIFIED_CONTAM: hypothetical protein Sangu_2608200 [Sesamum angustifolium]|uniref:Uncharacterized protein n=1 Tax=Sesamum angustifolium TaxID=2727405 RepID=A0AAW2J637_9LAMI
MCPTITGCRIKHASSPPGSQLLGALFAAHRQGGQGRTLRDMQYGQGASMSNRALSGSLGLPGMLYSAWDMLILMSRPCHITNVVRHAFVQIPAKDLLQVTFGMVQRSR